MKYYVAILLGLLSNLTFSAPNGQMLYQKHCASCHQFSGNGGIGLPLTQEKLSMLPQEYLFRTIRNGRPGRIMPAFTTLSDAQINSIVHHLRAMSDTPPFSLDPLNMSGDKDLGKQRFEQHCIKCHGEDGKGKGLGTGVTLSRERSFSTMPPSIVNKGFLESASDAMLFNTIKFGRKDTVMPSFATQDLNDQDIYNIITYLRSIKPDKKNEAYELSHIILTENDFETTIKNVKQAIVGGNFRVFPDRYLEQGVIDEFSVNKRQVAIRFCNFNTLYQALKIDPRLGTVLPCRITVIEQANGKVILVSPNMRYIANLFNNDELLEYAVIMDDIILDILDTASM